MTVRLHGDVGVQVVKSAVGLLTSVPAALIHALDLFVPATGSLVLLRTGNRDKGVDLSTRRMVSHAKDTFAPCAWGGRGRRGERRLWSRGMSPAAHGGFARPGIGRKNL